MRVSGTQQVYRHNHVNLGNVTDIVPFGMISSVASEGNTKDFVLTRVRPCGFSTNCCIETNRMQEVIASSVDTMPSLKNILDGMAPPWDQKTMLAFLTALTHCKTFADT